MENSKQKLKHTEGWEGREQEVHGTYSPGKHRIIFLILHVVVWGHYIRRRLANFSMKRRSFSVTHLFFLAIVSLPCYGWRRGRIFHSSVGGGALFSFLGRCISNCLVHQELFGYWRVFLYNRGTVMLCNDFPFYNGKACLTYIYYALFVRNHSTDMFGYPLVTNHFLGRINKPAAVHTSLHFVVWVRRRNVSGFAFCIRYKSDSTSCLYTQCNMAPFHETHG